ncbi:MAG: energy-coupling factor ABC transporter permease [Armatimonadetes bacterium]|nr:energy-coupling factor ABC transporter permease [Armatimonadota bacterium]
MHLPDGFLSASVSGAMYLASGSAVAVALRRAEADGDGADPGERGRSTVMMGIVAAFLFVAQMINFPVTGGTSGHLLGAALATALLGPWRAMLVMAVVVGLQAFIFADGGIAVLGANLFNMGVAGCLASGLVLSLAGADHRRRRLALAAAAWLSVLLGAGLTALEIGLSGRVPLAVVLPAMLSVHAVIGLGEALVSVAAWSLLVGARPDLATASREPGGEPWRLALVLALGLALVPLASSLPDGLESVAERQGFAQAAAPARPAPLADYALPGRRVTGFDALGTYLSAGVGMVGCAGLMLLVGAVRRRRPAEAAGS